MTCPIVVTPPPPSPTPAPSALSCPVTCINVTGTYGVNCSVLASDAESLTIDSIVASVNGVNELTNSVITAQNMPQFIIDSLAGGTTTITVTATGQATHAACTGSTSITVSPSLPGPSGLGCTLTCINVSGSMEASCSILASNGESLTNTSTTASVGGLTEFSDTARGMAEFNIDLTETGQATIAITAQGQTTQDNCTATASVMIP